MRAYPSGKGGGLLNRQARNRAQVQTLLPAFAVAILGSSPNTAVFDYVAQLVELGVCSEIMSYNRNTCLTVVVGSNPTVLILGSCDNWQSDGPENHCAARHSGFESLASRLFIWHHLLTGLGKRPFTPQIWVRAPLVSFYTRLQLSWQSTRLCSYGVM